MAAATTGFKLNRFAQIALIAGILVAINVIAQRWFTRADLTERREYTLAPATKKALQGLDDVVTVNAYFSRKLPPYMANLSRQVQDMLEEYRAYAGGKLALELIDPGDDPAAVQKMRMLGIPQVQLQVLERDQFQLSSIYLGLALLYGGRQEVIPVVQDTGNLEYELTAALLRLTSPQKKTVGWLGGEPAEAPLDRGGNLLRRELGKLYSVQEVGAAGLEKIPEGVQTLVVEGPQQLPDPARFALDQFLMRGGRAIFLVDHFLLPEGSMTPEPMESGVHDLLEHYGVKVHKDVVTEAYFNAPASFSSGFMQFRIPYPYWVRATRETLNREHPISGKIESIILPWTSSLEVAPPRGAAVKAEVLVRSSPEAQTETGNYDFSPQPRRGRAAATGAAGERALAVLLTGKFPSFWRDQAPPLPAAGGAAPAVLTESPETSILVLGTSRVAQMEFLRQFPENGAFLLNAVDWMTMGPDLIGIRSRVSDERVLARVPDQVKGAIKGLNVVGVPLLLVIIALVRLNVRRRKRAEP